MPEIPVRRFKGEDSTEKLTQSSVKASDCIQLRHDILGSSDSDKGIPFSIVKSGFIGLCETAGNTAAKVVSIQNMSDGFALENGIEVSVYMVHGNTAISPTFNVNFTGVVSAGLENQASDVNIGAGCWGDGVWLTLQYRKVTVNNTEIERWIIKGHNIAEQDTSSTSGYTKYADGTIIHLDNQIDIRSLVISQRVTSGGTITTYNNRKISDYRLLVIYICGAVSDIRNSLVVTRQYFEEVTFVAVHSHHNVGLSDVSGFEVVYIDDTHVKVNLTGQGALPYIRIDGIN